jgi:hypothetical protein
MGVGGQSHVPAALPPGMTRYALYRRLGGPQGRSGRVLKILPPPGFDPRTVGLILNDKLLRMLIEVVVVCFSVLSHCVEERCEETTKT